jgi:glycosyltransferase involved in cell wall biosynthesis
VVARQPVAVDVSRAMSNAGSLATEAMPKRVGKADACALPRVAIVGPAPPPSGGMANQCRQLVRLLHADGIDAVFVRTNAPYRPAWIGRMPVVRAAFRLLPYLATLWRVLDRVDVVHVFANSGWAWHLFAAPALVIARIRGVPAIVNYRGGNANIFLASAPRHVMRMLGGAASVIAPSEFLKRVFAAHGIAAAIVPNIVDLHRFSARPPRDFGDAPHLVVTRNLEAIYDIPTAIRAFARIRHAFPHARLTIAGTGPERIACERLAAELGLGESVSFPGRIDNDRIPALYASADAMLNPSTVDNMPISILEAFASGVPVVSTNVGGIPDMAIDGDTALLVPAHDAERMAAAAVSVLGDRALASRLVANGIESARRYDWSVVRDQWYAAYRAAVGARR